MELGKFLPFYPQQLLIRGVVVLSCGLLGAGALGLLFTSQSFHFTTEIEPCLSHAAALRGPFQVDLGLKEILPQFVFPQLDQEMSLSFEFVRPDRSSEKPHLLVGLTRIGQSKRCSLPCRIDLCYNAEGKLSFSETASPFWVELAQGTNGEVKANVFIEGIEKNETFFLHPQKNSLLTLEEIPVGSAFRILAEGRWWGRDLFCELYGGGASERVEIGSSPTSEVLAMKEGDWLSFYGNKWQRIGSLKEANQQPIARIRAIEAKSIIFEGWDGSNYYSFGLNQPPMIPFKVRPEELLTSVRVRSDRQISCMLENQCLVLKTGDWVFKGEGRWKIIRKKEDREALQTGKWIGEIFVFDRIDTELGQKIIRARLFNLSRSQWAPVEIIAKSNRANFERKLKARPR